MRTPVVVSWSGGKDSALALNTLLHSEHYEVVALLTTLTNAYRRIAMHGIRYELLVRQSRLACLPLVETWISSGAGNDEYEQVMMQHLHDLVEQGVNTIAFGDLFLEDIRAYRERLVGQVGMTPIFPIWGQGTTELARQFVEEGFQARTCCVDTAVLSETFCGRELTGDFFRDLPETVDPCGENGEFHTFVFDTPFFAEPIANQVGSMRRNGQFVFRDIVEL